MTKAPRAADWLVDLIASPAQKPSVPGQFMSPGQRNVHLASLGGFVRRKTGADGKELFTYLNAVNQASPYPLPDAEVRNTSDSIAKYDGERAVEHDDTHMSRELAQHFSGRFIWTAELGWLWYYNGRWTAEDAAAQVQESAKLFFEAIYEAVKAHAGADGPRVKSAQRLLGRSRINSIIDLAHTDPAVHRRIGQLDAKPGLLNLKNGTIEFVSGKTVFREHRAEDLLTQRADVDYDPDATCPNFDAVLAKALPEEERAFFLRLTGYAATGYADQQVLVIIHGPGANGKSTLMNPIQDLLGSYTVTVETSTFMSQRQASIRNDLARLRGARLAISSELGIGEILDASLMKKLTGGDKIAARFLHKEHFEFKPTAVPFFVTNALPVIDVGDGAIVRRLVLLGFNNIIPPEERDPSLSATLNAEKSGILNRLIEGMTDYLTDRKLRLPPSVVEATRQYGEASDLVQQFLNDDCQIFSQATVAAQELFYAYRAWCMGAGVRPLSQPLFKAELSKRPGISFTRRKAGVKWMGLNLKPRGL